MSKQDRQGVRTAQDLERKYKFGEIEKLIKELKRATKKAQRAIDDIKENMKSDISLDNKSDIFTATVSIFLEPGAEEAENARKYSVGLGSPTAEELALYDINGDGEVTMSEALQFFKISEGEDSLANWDKAVKSDVTITINVSSSEMLIKATGTNMWGRYVEYNTVEFIDLILSSIETNKLKISAIQDEINTLNEDIDDISSNKHIISSGTDSIWSWEKYNDGTARCWGIYEPGAVNFASLDNGFCSNAGSVNFPTDLFSSDDVCVLITTRCMSYYAFCTVRGAFKNIVKYRCMLLDTESDSGSYTVSYYIEARGKTELD